MNLKDKLLNFKEMRRKGGFTLVELIVVIAILAVLGGVAIPVYSGYVKKAELAADEALLREINTAFASACAINGEDHYSQPSNTGLTFSGNAVTGIKNAGDSVVDSFGKFFEMSDTEFKQMDTGEIMYKKAIGGFGLPGTVSYDHRLFASEKSVNDFNNSIYADENVMSIKDLLGNVDDIVDWADNELTGFDPKDVEGFEEFYKELTGEDATSVSKEKRLNAFVLYTAQVSEGLDYDAMKGFIQGTGGVGTTSDAENVASKAMKYAVGMAYVRDMNKKYESGEITGWTYVDPSDYDAVDDAIAPTIPDPDAPVGVNKDNTLFKDWFAANGEATMNGYLGAMDAISDNTGNLTPSEKNQLLNEGFNSTAGGNDFAALVEGLLGSTTIS